MTQSKTLGLNLYMPCSKIEENFDFCALREAVTEHKFHWRTNTFSPDVACMTMLPVAEIFEDLLVAYDKFIELEETKEKCLEIGEDIEEVAKMGRESLEYCLKVAKGEIKTTSTVLREFVRAHPTYKNDSILSEECLEDLKVYMHKLVTGEINPF